RARDPYPAPVPLGRLRRRRGRDARGTGCGAGDRGRLLARWAGRAAVVATASGEGVRVGAVLDCAPVDARFARAVGVRHDDGGGRGHDAARPARDRGAGPAGAQPSPGAGRAGTSLDAAAVGARRDAAAQPAHGARSRRGDEQLRREPLDRPRRRAGRGGRNREGPRGGTAGAAPARAVDPGRDDPPHRRRPSRLRETDVRPAAAPRLPRCRLPRRVSMGGPLEGVRVGELASIGPVPFCGLVLSDMGADVVRVDKLADVAAADPSRAPGTVLDRGRRSIGVDLKSPDGVDIVLRLVEWADVLVEGYRPGVAERLGIGPVDCQARNPRLVYGRLTGWGRSGPLADRAGHDIDYIALAGALSAFGRAGGPPTPPLNIVGDFGGGGLLLAYGIACALVAAARTGAGQVVDAAMVDGTALLMAPFYAARQIGFWSDERGTNLLDT